MISREQGIWGLAVTVSVLAHVMLLWSGSRLPSIDDTAEQDRQMALRLRFRALSKPQPPAPVPELKPRPAAPQRPKPEPRPKPTPRPAPKPEPQPPRPARKAVTPAAVETAAKEAEPAAAPAAERSADDRAADARARRNYLGRLIAHIEQYKYYPRVARRRGLQGVVKVSFVLLANGEIRDLRVGDGHKTLRKAAAQAVREALPLPVPPAAVHCPLRVSFGMAFRLL